MDECKPLPTTTLVLKMGCMYELISLTSSQGLTLVHFSAQLERFVWDGGFA